MKKCIKSVISILICLVFVAGSVSIGLNSITAKAYSSWQEAYNDFVLNSKYLLSGQDYSGKNNQTGEQPDFALHDMNSDGTPELIVYDGLWHPAAADGFNVYMCKNDVVQYIGSFTTYGVDYITGTEFNGLFLSFAHTGGYNIRYVSIGTNGKLKEELLVEGTDRPENDGETEYSIRITDKTENIKLYNAFCKAGGIDPDNALNEFYSGNTNIKNLNFFTLSEISSMGWASFCKKYGYTVSDSSEISYSILTSNQQKELESFLHHFLCTYSDSFANGSPATDGMTMSRNYDCNNASNSTLLACLLYYGGYSFFYDSNNFDADNRTEYWKTDNNYTKDPKQMYKSYTKTKASRVDWIAKNLFNCNDNDIDSMRKNGEKAFGTNLQKKDLACFYYHSGNYYCETTSGIGGPGYCEIIIDSIKKLGEYYGVEYTYALGDVPDPATYYVKGNRAILKYKTIDGKKYWSLYKHGKNINFNESLNFSKDVSDSNNYTIKYTDGTSDTFEHNLDYYISKADSTKYDPELAYILMSIAYAAYSEDTVKDMFETLEFTQINTSHETYIESNEVKMLENKIRYGLGAKAMSNGKTLVLIDIAGTNGDPLRNGDYLGPSGEWLSDLDLGFITQLSATGYHHGFEQAADYLIKGLNSFLSTNNIKKSEAIFAVTGHSRGAAVGNIVSCKLGVKKSNLYNYNFACPDVAVDTGVYWNLNGAHDNIFNISCNQDIVSMVPGYLGDLGIIIAINQWGKYGKSLWFCHDWSDMKYNSIKLSSHEQNNYLKYLRQKRPESELKDYFAMKTNIPNPLKWNGKIFGFLCPVDVKLTDDNGKVIAEVIDNKITQKDENVFIIINQDHKIVIVPDTEHTNVQITGTDEGEMTLLMRNFDSNSRNVTDSVDFKNVEVHKDKTILTEWGGNIKSTDTVLKDGETGEIINADKTEDSVKNDSVGEKKNNKTALYIIIAVAAAAAIAAVTAVIIIKKRKSKKAAETGQRIIPEYENAGYEPVQNENAYTAPPSPPIQPANSAKGAETAEKKPETLMKYACKPTGRPGQCAKCKSDTSQLYFIVAEKSGKRQSITVCKDCAEKIITRFKKQNQESDRT